MSKDLQNIFSAYDATMPRLTRVAAQRRLSAELAEVKLKRDALAQKIILARQLCAANTLNNPAQQVCDVFEGRPIRPPAAPIPAPPTQREYDKLVAALRLIVGNAAGSSSTRVTNLCEIATEALKNAYK